MAGLSLQEVGTILLVALLFSSTGFFQAAGEDLWHWTKDKAKSRKKK